MSFLSYDEKQLLSQANRRLTNMRKRAKTDKNVENALTFAESDINIIGKGKVTKFKVTQSMTERQKKSMLRIAEQLIESPYSTQKETINLYKRQQETFAKRYNLSKKQAKEMISLFDAKKNPEVAEAWQKIKSMTSYDAIVPLLRNDEKLGDVVNDIGHEKFGQMMRLYIEGSMMADNYSFADFLSDREIVDFFKTMSVDEINNFIDIAKEKDADELKEMNTDELKELVLK